MQDSEIAVCGVVKFLKVDLYARITFKAEINHLVYKYSNAMYVIRSLRRTLWGAD